MRRAVAGALAAAGLLAGILVAMLDWSPRPAHPPTSADWVVQALVMIVAAGLVLARVRGKR